MPAREGYRYAFPRDHGSHDEFRTEWWYYTGNLATNDGRPFGYQLTFFRRSIPLDTSQDIALTKWSITQLYLAHFAVSDLKNGRFHVFEKISRAGVGKAGRRRNVCTCGSTNGAPNPADSRRRGQTFKPQTTT